MMKVVLCLFAALVAGASGESCLDSIKGLFTGAESVRDALISADSAKVGAFCEGGNATAFFTAIETILPNCVSDELEQEIVPILELVEGLLCETATNPSTKEDEYCFPVITNLLPQSFWKAFLNNDLGRDTLSLIDFRESFTDIQLRRACTNNQRCFKKIVSKTAKILKKTLKLVGAGRPIAKYFKRYAADIASACIQDEAFPDLFCAVPFKAAIGNGFKDACVNGKLDTCIASVMNRQRGFNPDADQSVLKDFGLMVKTNGCDKKTELGYAKVVLPNLSYTYVVKLAAAFHAVFKSDLGFNLQKLLGEDFSLKISAAGEGTAIEVTFSSRLQESFEALVATPLGKLLLSEGPGFVMPRLELLPDEAFVNTELPLLDGLKVEEFESAVARKARIEAAANGGADNAGGKGDDNAGNGDDKKNDRGDGSGSASLQVGMVTAVSAAAAAGVLLL